MIVPRTTLRTLGLLALLAGSATRTLADEPPSSTETGFYSRFLATHLSVGLRMTHFWLDETRRSDANGLDNGNLTGNFLGSLWGLDPVQHDFPTPFLEYRVVSVVGLGSSYSQYRAKTLDWADQAAGITAGDGDVQVRGLDAYLVGRFRLGRRIKPYVQAGRTWYRSEFFASPGWLIPGRRFVAYDTTGWLASAGLTVRVVKHLDLEAAYRHTWMDDVQARAYLKGNKYRGGAFPLANDALSFGAAFAF